LNSDAACAGACTGGVCTGACTNNAQQCGLNGVPQLCVSGAWQPQAPCDGSNGWVCDPQKGECDGECQPGAVECASGTALRTCGPNGYWGNAAACQGGACIPSQSGDDSCGGVCSPGAIRCSTTGDNLQVCDANGQWGLDRRCADEGLRCLRISPLDRELELGCGQCSPGSATAANRRCHLPQGRPVVEECRDDAKWSLQDECDNHCLGGICDEAPDVICQNGANPSMCGTLEKMLVCKLATGGSGYNLEPVACDAAIGEVCEFTHCEVPQTILQ
jgi:hypothetical protein